MSVKSIENGSLTLNNLDVSTINNSVYPPVSGAGTLSAVLTSGNDATGQSITGVNNIALTTINSSVYPPATPSFSSVLTAGNSAGNQSISGVNDIAVTTINGSSYPPVVSTLASVLGAGNDAGNQSITGVNNIALTTINSSAYPPATPSFSSVLTAGNDAGNQSITGVNNIALTTINGSAYPPSVSTPNLTDVLTAGNNGGGVSIQNLANIYNLTGVIKYDNILDFGKVVPSIPAIATGIVPSFEFTSYNLTGSAGSVSQALPLANNITATTNYAVFPSIYYGYSGSSGTYDLNGTLNALTTNIIISDINASSFTFNLNKTTGNNVNIYITFLVIYQASGTEFNKSY